MVHCSLFLIILKELGPSLLLKIIGDDSVLVILNLSPSLLYIYMLPSAQWLRICLLMQEMQVRSLNWEDPLENEMANPLQYSCLGSPMQRGAWRAKVHGVTKESDMINHEDQCD